MRGKIIVLLLLSSILLCSNTTSKVNRENIQPNQATELIFNQTVYNTISLTSQNYLFTLDQYTNVTISIVTTGNLTIGIPYYDNLYTNYGNLSYWLYLPSSNYQYSIHIYPEHGESQDYALTLTNGNPVVDTNNHVSDNQYR